MGIKVYKKENIKLPPNEKKELVKINPEVKRKGFNDIFEEESLIKQTADQNFVPYLFLHLQKFCEEENVTIKEVFLLLYLNELGIFNHRINLIEGEFQVGYISEKGFIETDFTYKRTNYWCLSDKGKKVVERFYKQLKSNDSLLTLNRQTEVDVESKLKATLSALFSKPM